jgi:hypothetical protein
LSGTVIFKPFSKNSSPIPGIAQNLPLFDIIRPQTPFAPSDSTGRLACQSSYGTTFFIGSLYVIILDG